MWHRKRKRELRSSCEKRPRNLRKLRDGWKSGAPRGKTTRRRFPVKPGPLVRVQTRTQTSHNLLTSETFLFFCVFVCASVLAGCAGRKPVVSRAPSTPVSTPPSTEEEAKRSTSIEFFFLMIRRPPRR